MVLASGEVATVSTTLTGPASVTAATTSNVALPIIGAVGTVAAFAAAKEIGKIAINWASKTIVQQKTTDMVWAEVPATTGSPAQQGWVNVRSTLERIEKGESFPHHRDGSLFKNRDTTLPVKSESYYKEYVHPTLGLNRAGLERIVVGKNGKAYYSPDHYETFVPIN